VGNTQTIADMSAVLLALVKPAVHHVAPDATVRLGPPLRQMPGAGAEVSIFLYQMTGNAAFSNHSMMPGERRAALDLHYVIAIAGQKDLAVEQIAGAMVACLKGAPVLSHDQTKVLERTMSMEELAMLWGSGFQVPLQLSLFYTIGPVLIELDS